jgi:hypothetical protein
MVLGLGFETLKIATSLGLKLLSLMKLRTNELKHQQSKILDLALDTTSFFLKKNVKFKTNGFYIYKKIELNNSFRI